MMVYGGLLFRKVSRLKKEPALEYCEFMNIVPAVEA